MQAVTPREKRGFVGTANGSVRPSWEHSGGRAVAWQAVEDRKGQLSPRGPRIRFQLG